MATTHRCRLRQNRKRRVKIRVQKNKNKLRLSVFKSDKHIYAQIIDDIKGQTMAAESTVSKAFKECGVKSGNIEAAKWVGTSLGKKAGEKGVKEVYYDRGGFRYHGRVKALADSVRALGVKF
tara:strand:+ start:110 stop:475 length:366 start_codon:yes stop_codon:yes gene_type:complete